MGDNLTREGVIVFFLVPLISTMGSLTSPSGVTGERCDNNHGTVAQVRAVVAALPRMWEILIMSHRKKRRHSDDRDEIDRDQERRRRRGRVISADRLGAQAPRAAWPAWLSHLSAPWVVAVVSVLLTVGAEQTWTVFIAQPHRRLQLLANATMDLARNFSIVKGIGVGMENSATNTEEAIADAKAGHTMWRVSLSPPLEGLGASLDATDAVRVDAGVDPDAEAAIHAASSAVQTLNRRARDFSSLGGRIGLGHGQAQAWVDSLNFGKGYAEASILWAMALAEEQGVGIDGAELHRIANFPPDRDSIARSMRGETLPVLGYGFSRQVALDVTVGRGHRIVELALESGSNQHGIVYTYHDRSGYVWTVVGVSPGLCNRFREIPEKYAPASLITCGAADALVDIPAPARKFLVRLDPVRPRVVVHH